MKTLINKISKLVDWAMAMYDKGMKKVFDVKFLHTYYDSQEHICEMLRRKYLRKTNVTLDELLNNGFENTIGEKLTKKIANKRIRHHAFFAFCVTTICTLPPSWIMWPAMNIDIIFFQYEQFAVSQELEVIHSRTITDKRQFNYDSLAVSALKMSGVVMKAKIQDTAKKAFSSAIRSGIKKGSTIFRGPMKGLLRQGLKWGGIMLVKNGAIENYDVLVDMIIDISVVTICALIAGFVSYWLFVPMSKRLQLSLIEEQNA
ncbi:MAG: hypothetical protein J6U33_01090 [Paludibacteraceae bacterium]|nr:hypothetical protein [Paludibacteraceae bacterium]